LAAQKFFVIPNEHTELDTIEGKDAILRGIARRGEKDRERERERESDEARVASAAVSLAA